MKIFFLTGIFALSSFFAICQSPAIKWGEECDVKKNSNDLELIHADDAAVYVQESHSISKYFDVNHPNRGSATLFKFDKELKQLYSSNFDKELKKKDIEKFLFINNKLIIVASGYADRDKILTLYAAEIDKNTGEKINDWTELGSWEKEHVSNSFEFRADYSADSSKMQVVVTIVTNNKKTGFDIRQFDADFKPVGKRVLVSHDYYARQFLLDDVVYSSSGNVAVIAKTFDMITEKKRVYFKTKSPTYILQIYGNDGNLVKEINPAIDDKEIVNLKLVLSPAKDFVLTSFYSDVKYGVIKGISVRRINPQTGEITLSKQKEIETGMITPSLNVNEFGMPEPAEPNEGITRYMKFRKFIFTPDNGIVVIAEKYNKYERFTSSFAYKAYDCEDILMFKVDAGSNISWIKTVPKQQHESTPMGSGNFTGFEPYIPPVGYLNQDYFNFPFYAGIGIYHYKNKVQILFNDSEKNANVTRHGDMPVVVDLFKKSTCYSIILNTETGEYSRMAVFSNKDEDVLTAMPRLGKMLGNSSYLLAHRQHLVGKAKFAVARLNFTP